MTTLEWRLPPTARSVPDARRHVREALSGWRLDDLLDTALLLTSEVVTNAVLHARTPLLLTVTADNGQVRISVSDDSPVPPALRRHSSTATTGRGMRMLDRLADAWATDGRPSGKTVWFTLSRGRDPWSRTIDVTEIDA